MENANFVEELAARLGQSASVKNVYGEPIAAEGKTIIPVARVAFGFGGGFGKGKKKDKISENPADLSDKNPEGEGAGGGGGMRAKAVGVYEITNNQTKFIPVNNNKQIVIAAIVGFMVRGWLAKRKR
jgi:uncharacterized spore protein YtfJ